MSAARFALGRRDAVQQEAAASQAKKGVSAAIQTAVSKKIIELVNVDAIERIDQHVLHDQIESAVAKIANEDKLQLSKEQQSSLASLIIDDMRGIGPLEQLLKDPGINDIMVSGPHKVFVERAGRLHLCDVSFRDEDHVLLIAQRIARQVGRRVDESTPICDARLPDGSRVAIIIPPIAIDGTMISIRRFPNQGIGLDELVMFGSMSAQMRDFLILASRARLNMAISGGTGSGKTTLLNALSQHINPAESIITIEDSAELQLKQPNVRRLETRPQLADGMTEISQRDLVKASLRLRPDRIIVGEVRDAEAFYMLQAMNSGHDGSMTTLHANSPRDALSRLENLVMMADIDLPSKAIRTQVTSAIDLIIQAERMADGLRRVTDISEVVGMEGEMITLQSLFSFEVESFSNGVLVGKHKQAQTSLSQNSLEKFRRSGLIAQARGLFSGR